MTSGKLSNRNRVARVWLKSVGETIEPDDAGAVDVAASHAEKEINKKQKNDFMTSCQLTVCVFVILFDQINLVWFF